MTQPPSAPTLHTKRCETCEHLKKDCPYFESGYEPLEDSTAPTEFLRGCYFVLRYRCPAHSGTPDADARERIEGVLTVAEDAIKIATLLCVSNVSREFTLNEVIPKLEKRIALLKDGVGRK